MMQRTLRILVLVIAIGFAGLVPFGARPASAHEHVTVGEYELTVGWRDEPAVAGFVNGIDLGIVNGTGAPVVGVEGNLTAVLSTGPASSTPKALQPQFGRDGWYTFDVIPTRAGSYTLRLTGTLGSTSVNVSVILDAVSPASDLAFPVADPTAGDLQNRLDAANAQISGLQSQIIIALVVALVGVGVGVVGIARTVRRTRGPGNSQ